MKQVILHIGSGKTGTTSIQGYLHDNSHWLKSQHGIDFLEYGLVRHNIFGDEFFSHIGLVRWIKERDLGKVRELYQKIASSSCDVIILSCEGFYHRLDASDIAFLSDQLGEYQVKIICYVRRQDLLLESAWKHQVKVGLEKDSFKDFCKRHTHPESLLLRRTNYYRFLSHWKMAFKQSEFLVRPFERPRFKNRDLLTDFFTSLDLPAAYDPKKVHVSKRNISISSDLAELLRFFYIHGVVKGDAKHQSDFLAFLADSLSFTDPPLLSYEERCHIIRFYDEPNRLLFSEFADKNINGFMFDDLEKRLNDPPFSVDITAMLAEVQYTTWKHHFNPRLSR